MDVLQQGERVCHRCGIEPADLVPDLGRGQRAEQKVKRRRAPGKEGEPFVGVEAPDGQLELHRRFPDSRGVGRGGRQSDTDEIIAGEDNGQRIPGSEAGQAETRSIGLDRIGDNGAIGGQADGGGQNAIGVHIKTIMAGGCDG